MYDVIIIWAWSAGLTAWLYASRYWMSNVIIWELLWWALTYAHKVENFPWFENISWFDIMDKLLNQAKNFWSEIIQDKIVDITKIDNYFLVKTSFQKEFQTKTILIAIWNKHRKLWVLW
jgi:thioredoxin reductase